MHGKSDTVDAEAAARAVLNGQANVTPKAGTGPVEAVRQLRIARSGTMKVRTAAANQLHSLCDTAPDHIRRPALRRHAAQEGAIAERWRPGTATTAEAAAKRALMTVARRWRTLDDEACELSPTSKRSSMKSPPRLLALHGSATRRLASSSSPRATIPRAPRPREVLRRPLRVLADPGVIRENYPASPHRGGDRHANSALWTIVLVRMGNHQPTKGYVARRTAEGLSKLEIMRCLKRMSLESPTRSSKPSPRRHHSSKEVHRLPNCCLTSRGAPRSEPLTPAGRGTPGTRSCGYRAPGSNRDRAAAEVRATAVS